ncbi:MAG: toprim domain-containing protein [Anaerolineae bacterium]|nr:toprim domain-containing protein [Anaerolineae bacterium]
MARRSIRERETAVLVEGYMDVMQARQAGFDNVVAQMGTALTETQLRQLSKYARRLILALDPDVAGVRATMRDLEVAREALSEDTAPTFDARGMIRLGGQLDIDIRILRLPKGKDPDDLIREQPEVWQRLLDEALPVAKYVIEQATQGRDLADAFDREQVARELLPILSATERQLQTQNNLQELARAVRIPERTLIAWANAQRAQPARPRRRPKAEPPPEAEAEPPPAKATAAPLSVSWQERYCMAALLKRQDLIYHIDRCLQALDLPRLSANDFTQTALQAIFRAFQASLAQDEQDPIDYMRATLPAVLAGELDALLQFEPPGHILRSIGHFMQSQPLHSVLLDAKGMADALELLLGLRERLLQRAIEQLYFLQAEAQEDGDLTRAAELGTIVDQHRRDLQRLHKEGILTIRSLSG